MVVLQPTSPLRKHEDINRACNLIKQNKHKSLFSISDLLNILMRQLMSKKENGHMFSINQKIL